MSRALTVKRKGYYAKRGGKRVRVPKTTFKIKDRGKPGRTPKSEHWFRPEIETGWLKTDPQAVRIKNLVKSHKGDLLAAARSAQALANVQKRINPSVARKARSDAKALFRAYKKSKKR